MPRVSLVEFFFRAIPEGFAFIFAVYALSKTKVDKSRFIISSLIFMFIPDLIKLLPIDYGIHTLIGMIFQVILTTYVNKINVIKSIRASILSVVIMFICEGINIGVLYLVVGKNLNSVLSNPVTRLIYGYPSLIIFACIIGVYYFKKIKKSN